MNIRQGQTWKFNGGDGTPNINHTITEVSSEGVTTWSEACECITAEASPDGQGVPEGEVAAGFSWFGPVPDFLQQFTFVAETRPPKPL